MTFNRQNTLIILLLCLVFVFLCIRTVMVDMTHDEAYSFLNIKHFWYAQFLCNANSHWINSFGMKCASLLGFERPWQLRWLSLLSSAAILLVAYKWINTFAKPATRLFAFSLAFLNPFVLDYFVLARGYVSGIAFEVVGLFFFISFLKRTKRSYAFFALICSGLSAVANFNFLYTSVAFFAVYFYSLYFKNGLSFLKNRRFYTDLFISFGFILLVLRALLFIKRCSNDFGLGDTNFIECLFSSYIDGLLYGNEGLHDFDPYAFGLFTLILASVVYGILRLKKHNNLIYFYSSIIFGIYLFLVLFNHFVFGILFPYYRSALPMFPLLVISLVSFFSHTINNSKAGNTFFYIMSMALAVNFIRGINFHSTIDFLHQCDSKASFELVESLGAKKVGLTHEHQGVYINYYQQTDHFKYKFQGERLNTYDEDPDWTEKDKLENFDYLILYPPYNLGYYKKRKIKFSGTKLFPVSKTVIIKVEK